MNQQVANTQIVTVNWYLPKFSSMKLIKPKTDIPVLEPLFQGKYERFLGLNFVTTLKCLVTFLDT